MVEAFIAAVEKGVDLVPVVADSTSTAKIAPFIKQFPGRLVNVGIAEQSMVGTAAGLALGGKVAVTCNAAPFLVSRANEQIKVDVATTTPTSSSLALTPGPAMAHWPVPTMLLTTGGNARFRQYPDFRPPRRANVGRLSTTPGVSGAGLYPP